ncbi:MAG TPA: alpha/beta hydrolase [Flavisolibacter sp.]
MQDLMLVHGAIGSSKQLRGLEESLKDLYRVHNPDLPAHGGQPMVDQFSISFFADHIIQYCDEHKIDKFSIFGYSMGGYIALYLARHYPARVEKVVTLATKFHWDPMIAQKEIQMLQPGLIKEKLPKFALDLSERHAPNDWGELLQKTAGMLERLGQQNELNTEDHKEIKQPVLVMLGDRDKMVGLDETVAVYKLLNNAQLAILPGTPHPIEQVNTELLSFFIRKFIG